MSTTIHKRSVPASAKGPAPSAKAAGHPDPRKHRNRLFCRTSEYKPPGSDRIGLTPTNQPSKVVWELDYGLNEVQFKQLSARFPGVAFVQTGMECHDHPIAHTSYRIVWENVTRKLRPGQKVADISGNPQWNEAFNLRQARRDNPIVLDSYCKVMSPKDSIRAKVRWGPQEVGGKRRWEEMTLYDMYRNPENCNRFSKYDVFLMNHVLYYHTFAEINRLLNLNRDSVLYATIHKLEGQNGTINCGEQKYEKDFVSGKVCQTNVETGETYEHPDPMPWFRKFSYADEHGAFAWTINKGCDDTYVITATSTEPSLVPEEHWLNGRVIFDNGIEKVYVDAQRIECGDPPPEYSVEVVSFKTTDLIPDIGYSKERKVRITHPELYDSLRKFMINKPRNHRTLQDLTAKAHREAGNNTLVGVNKRINISAEALTEHIFAAWMTGVGHEADMFNAAVCSGSYASAVNRNLSGRGLQIGSNSMVKQMAGLALRASLISQSKQPVHAVLTHLEELL